jgi:glycine oxidase
MIDEDEVVGEESDAGPAPAGADVVVVGAGLIGCAAALRLAQAGLSVVVLDRSPPGSESSWAAAGILGAQAEPHEPGLSLTLGVASRALFPALEAELLDLCGLGFGLSHGTGVLDLAFEEQEIAGLRKKAAWQREAGQEAGWLDAAQVRELGAPHHALGGLWLPGDGRVDPRLLVAALHAGAVKQGAKFVHGVALAVEERGGRVRGVRLAPAVGAGSVHESDGGHDAGAQGVGALVEGRHVVIAAGSWSGQIGLSGVPRGAVRPLRGQLVALPLPPGIVPPVLFAAGAPRGYLVPRKDRVIVGVTVEDVGFEKAVTPEGLAHLRAVTARLYRGPAPAPLDSWSGLRPGSRDGLPLLGAPRRGPEGLIVATGHHRNGVLLAPLTGLLVRDLVLGRPTGFDLSSLSPDRFA